MQSTIHTPRIQSARVQSARALQLQPTATYGMIVAPGGGGNRNAKNMPVDEQGREWSNGLCGCMGDCGTCCKASFCPCIVYGQNRHRYENLRTHGVPHPNKGGCVSGSCFGHCLVSICGLGFLLQMCTRGDMRKRYNIKGGGCGDCCAALWCTPCELTQEARELQLEEDSFEQRY
jgi:Cys-rich protein (TIGR01571 family)